MSNSLLFLQLALERAKECIPTPSAFCVGCVITVPHSTSDVPIVLETGFSRELPGNTHAEANALTKTRSLTSQKLSELLGEESPPEIEELLKNADVYTTMEPCSVRLSGLAPCADALIEANVRRCIIGVGEPADFVKCEGATKLQAAGIEVVWVSGLEEECLEVARRGHPPVVAA
ncbi:diaminohydroxyphosphoribosylamino-pyrimidine deaminase [Cantharellus anzutake]|uniref:diaminohydroxyphosphoribosylamino-pyrimidine deaminase n=1 Tax=Cantharellus anzutake TaxID=1750568 RepID=UPI0019036A44|nr:diaminohydroxyphosphoribosylamino-pyrimidine deaminase [Cantharellus anzutake]KAF8332266.1 diaminohydroxyphosphoribosylamino-pyrimidine deaminase [Cantharellus anzutake]